MITTGPPRGVDIPALPWSPHRLVNLWELMKSFEAHDLLNAVRELNNRSALIFESSRGPAYRLRAVDSFVESLRRCQDICREIDLPMSALHASQLLDAVIVTREQLDTKASERIAAMLSVTIENELSLCKIFALSQEEARYYGNESPPFGQSVATAFPSTSFDAVEASRCFALGRSTASAFHLMRVLELGLRVMADRFKIPSDHTNWHKIIEGIEKAVRNMPNEPNRASDWKEQQEFFSQAASHFMVTKDAWRNYTAHARGKYTDEEAETLMINVRAFMQKLASRLSE